MEDEITRANDGDAAKPTDRSTATSIDDYIAAFPEETQRVLQEMRVLIRGTAPARGALSGAQRDGHLRRGTRLEFRVAENTGEASR